MKSPFRSFREPLDRVAQREQSMRPERVDVMLTATVTGLRLVRDILEGACRGQLPSAEDAREKQILVDQAIIDITTLQADVRRYLVGSGGSSNG
jgi:hypothetical protein